jgi:hypothetical protein
MATPIFVSLFVCGVCGECKQATKPRILNILKKNDVRLYYNIFSDFPKS